jgi:hypothetical protein
MDGKHPKPEEPALPGFGVTRDLKQLQTHSTASLAELREFLTQMRGRRPQEVLGLVAGSHLLRSVAVATLGAVVILAVGSVGPWWLNRLSAEARSAAKPGESPKAAAAAPKEAKKAEKSEKPSAEPPTAAAPATAAADAKPSPADAEKAIKVMGLGDTKVADPKTNPLEKSLDNLLDKIE